MKIWCDVCDKEEAVVFCSADEAALCEGCDHRVHHANKLASKHTRFSLLHPTFKESPLCDICQERRAFLFCQEDRAILCRECDVPIHRANEHTLKHNRFLLTGVKLSSSSSSSSLPKCLNPTSSSSIGSDDQTAKSNSQSSKRPRSVSNNKGNLRSPSLDDQIPLPTSTSNCYRVEDNCTSDTASISTSSISEYLMETLPGWRVDDFLDPSSSSANHGFCKTFDGLVPVMGEDCWLQSEAIRVPEVSQASFFVPQSQSDGVDGFNFKGLKEANVLNSGCVWDDQSFVVPQISSSFVNKSRHFP